MHANIDPTNVSSLQRGARNFMNYCSGCHSAKYVRYSRVADDLGIPEDMLKKNLMFTSERVHDTIKVAMPTADAAVWFGKAPPDLSLVARSRGADWLYGFLKTYYLEEFSPTGVNNLTFPNTGMPHVLWELQGWQRPVFHPVEGADGERRDELVGVEPIGDGLLNPDEYDVFVRDLVNFLDYLGEPVKAKRTRLGVKVIAFLLVFTLLAWALKREYWKDIK
ncbi:MAG: cytochrome c1 [Gammaproteobacteria bacterium]|nr:cytochrome c1 [Gammaproteobacteria bacterium]